MTTSTRRPWVALAVLALPCLMYAIDLTALTVAVPQLTTHLHPSAAQLLWINDVYGFLLAGSLLLMGNLGDRIGRRRLLLIGAAAFGAASLGAAYARTPNELIAARAALGVAGATLAPSTLSLIGTLFPDPRRRTTAVAVWIMSFSAGGALGPVLAGALLTRFWWGSVFLLAVPVMVLLLAVGPRLLPEVRDPDAGALDVPSVLLSLVAVLALVWGLKRAALGGIGPAAVLPAAGGVALAVVFVRRQRGRRNPLVDLALFRVPALTAALLTYAVSLLVISGVFLFTVQYLQLVLGLSPLVAGLWSAMDAVALVVASMLTPAVAARVRPAVLVPAGLLLAAAGMAVVALAGVDSAPALIATGNVLTGLGLAPVVTLANDLVVSSAPPRRAGAAAALSETSAELGGALGIALLGALGTAVFRGRAGGGQGTLGDAIAAAHRLPPRAGGALLDASRAAFTDGLHVVALTAAATLLVTAVVAALLLRPAPQREAVAPATPPAVPPAPARRVPAESPIPPEPKPAALACADC